MRAYVLRRHGRDGAAFDPAFPDPAPGPRDLLVEVHAAGLNPLDFKIRDGALRVVRRFPRPIVLGNELAGRVVAVGPEVTRFRPGDAVMARVEKARLGAFAELACVDEAVAARKPARLSFVEAAGLPLAALTAHQVLFEALDLREGQKVLVHGGAGGVGSMALQLLRGRGLFVATTASAKNHPLVRDLGADLALDYRAQRFEDELRGYDAVFDTMGGDTLRRSFGVLRPGGRVASIAGVPDPETARRDGLGWLPYVLFWLGSFASRRQAARVGARYGYWFMRPDGEQLARLGARVEEGALRTTVDRTYPLEKADEALAYLETGHARGKVVLAVRADA